MHVYTIGVQRWPLPIFKKYRVTFHDLVAFAGGARLILDTADSARLSLSLGRFARKGVKVYPDYWIIEQTKRDPLVAIHPPGAPVTEVPDVRI